jgi:hypothetical protein
VKSVSDDVSLGQVALVFPGGKVIAERTLCSWQDRAQWCH